MAIPERSARAGQILGMVFWTMRLVAGLYVLTVVRRLLGIGRRPERSRPAEAAGGRVLAFRRKQGDKERALRGGAPSRGFNPQAGAPAPQEVARRKVG